MLALFAAAFLADGDWNQRIQSVHRLDDHRGPAAVAELARAAKDEDWQVRLTAVHFLGRAGAVEQLKAVARGDSCRHVRLSAVHWLGALKAADVPARELGRASDRFGCLSGLDYKRSPKQAPVPVVEPEEEGEEPVVPPPDLVLPVAAPAPSPPPEPGDDWLDRLLADDDEAQALPPELSVESPLRTPEQLPPVPLTNREPSTHPDPSLVADHGSPKQKRDPVPALLEQLESYDRRKRARAADELGKLRAERAVTALIARLSDKSPQVRASAALALGNIGPAASAAVPKLVKALSDGHEEVEVSAAAALGRLGAGAAFKKHLRQVIRR